MLWDGGMVLSRRQELSSGTVTVTSMETRATSILLEIVHQGQLPAPIPLAVNFFSGPSMNPMSLQTTSSSSSSSSYTAKTWIMHGLLAGAAIVEAIGARAYQLSRSGRLQSCVVGIRPTRFGSSQFQGKPLVHILGKPMIQLWQQMMKRLQNVARDSVQM